MNTSEIEAKAQTDTADSADKKDADGDGTASIFGPSRIARAYRLTDEARGKRFTDLAGRTYGVNQDGSMVRLDKPLSKKARRRMEAAKNGKSGDHV